MWEMLLEPRGNMTHFCMMLWQLVLGTWVPFSLCCISVGVIVVLCVIGTISVCVCACGGACVCVCVAQLVSRRVRAKCGWVFHFILGWILHIVGVLQGLQFFQSKPSRNPVRTKGWQNVTFVLLPLGSCVTILQTDFCCFVHSTISWIRFFDYIPLQRYN